MNLSPLSLDTLEAIKRDALEVFTMENVAQAALDAATALIVAVDAECDRRTNWVLAVSAALEAVR